MKTHRLFIVLLSLCLTVCNLTYMGLFWDEW